MHTLSILAANSFDMELPLLSRRSLDISFNLLRKVPEDQLRTLPKLQTLYMIQNKISKIEGLECIAGTLKSVEFGGNKLRVRPFH